MRRTKKSLTKKIRFEVFKRDSFKCQYCGAAAPDVMLEVDHIDPVSKGGANEMVNYITACRSCNAGKSNRNLSDNTTLAKQRAQLEELNERREQLEMMLEWRSGMKEIEGLQVEKAAALWSAVAAGWRLNEQGKKGAAKMIKKYGLPAVMDAIEVSADAYIIIEDESGMADKDSVEKAWLKVAGVLAMKAMPHEERELHYIKGILKNRLQFVPYDVIRDLKFALENGVAIQEMKLEARYARNWTSFNKWLQSSVGA